MKNGELMQYHTIYEGIFHSRPNRFIAYIDVNGQREKCHVKNTGRCKELLYDGVKVYVEESDKPERKTKYSLINVMKGERLINMDSQAPNKVVHEWLAKEALIHNVTKIKPEYTYGDSRVDFYVEAKNEDGTLRKILMEVKGVTLEEEGVVRFPDAPTERGIKHIHELAKATKEGYESYIFFVIQMKGVSYFEPNHITHPEFAKALADAVSEGVHVLAYDCEVGIDTLAIREPVEVRL